MPVLDTTKAPQRRAALEVLGNEICELAAHISAATYRLLEKIATFDEARGWAEWGCKSCAHWLNWRCGLDLRSAREKVRVAHALRDLPLVSEAFSRGELSYSKVRALTRIASPETEDDLLIMARCGTAAHLEKIVRGYRRAASGAEEASREESTFSVDWQWDGRLHLEGTLSPEEGAVFLEALQAARDEIRARRRAAGSMDRPVSEEDGSAEPSSTKVEQAEGLMLLAESALSGGLHDSRTADRYQVMVHVDATLLAGGEGACHIETGSRVDPEVVRRLACDCGIIGVAEDKAGNVLDIGRKTRAIPPAIRRALRIRDGGCKFPGCTNQRFVDAHHAHHWIDGGPTALQNLVLLCRFHHLLVHEGGFVMKTEPDGRFTFVRPDGSPVETAPFVVDPRAFERLNVNEGLAIDATTPVAQWAGEGCDYGVAVAGLLARNGMESCTPSCRASHPESGAAEPPSARTSAPRES